MTITRSDGTSTWSVLRRGIEDHDLAHLAVEKTLGCKSAFFGLVDQGVNISDFEHKDRQPAISIEAKQVEHLVLLLQIETKQSEEMEDLLHQYRDILVAHDLPYLENLNQETLHTTRRVFKGLVKDWRRLKVGEFLIYHL